MRRFVEADGWENMKRKVPKGITRERIENKLRGVAGVMKTVKRGEDYWEKGQDGRTWTRVHVKQRQALFTPTGTRDGPDVSKLE